MMVARVFPRRTAATPTDALAFVGPPGLFPPKVDRVHVSVTFTWDRSLADQLARAWAPIAPVAIGGPGTGMRGEQFTPGQYLRRGYVITSRGCPNRCWFCSVPKREGTVRELVITEGWNVLDDNLLACSSGHVLDVIDMLRRQRRPAEFTGGLEAARLEPWHAEALRSIHPKQVFFAYDEAADWEPLARAAAMMWRAGFRQQWHSVRAYVLCGAKGDTMQAAEGRMRQVLSLGIVPMAMLWRNQNGHARPGWTGFQRRWARPALMMAPKPITGGLFEEGRDDG